MVIRVNGKNISLRNEEVKSCKKCVAKFLKNIRDLSEERSLPTYYFTTLVVMQAMSQELLSTYDPDSFAEIMNAFYKYFEENKDEA